jgi:anti-sigma regulatory factor (Ser/Thr protein kinase)
VQKSFSRSLASLSSVYEFTEAALAAGNFTEAARFPVHLATEELFVNMVEYNPETTTDIDMKIEVVDAVANITMIEYGVPEFDVSKPRAVNIDAPLEERTPGGLGLHLIQKMVDNLTYEYCDGRSTISFSKQSGNQDV